MLADDATLVECMYSIYGQRTHPILLSVAGVLKIPFIIRPMEHEPAHKKESVLQSFFLFQ